MTSHIINNQLVDFNSPEHHRAQMKARLEPIFNDMLLAMELDPEATHLKGTPERMARMYIDEIFVGLYSPKPRFTTFDNDTESTSMVFLGNIDIFSTCSHHFKAFTGFAHIAYIPKRDGQLVGISKLARIADWFARRPQVQEVLTDEIADFLMHELDAAGVGVDISAVHNCIRVRGAKQSQSIMNTTTLRGCFLKDKKVNDEFMAKIERLT